MTQIKCKHEPVVTKGSHCFVALCFAVASEIISILPSRERAPYPALPLILLLLVHAAFGGLLICLSGAALRELL